MLLVFLEQCSVIQLPTMLIEFSSTSHDNVSLALGCNIPLSPQTRMNISYMIAYDVMTTCKQNFDKLQQLNIAFEDLLYDPESGFHDGASLRFYEESEVRAEFMTGSSSSSPNSLVVPVWPVLSRGPFSPFSLPTLWGPIRGYTISSMDFDGLRT